MRQKQYWALQAVLNTVKATSTWTGGSPTVTHLPALLPVTQPTVQLADATAGCEQREHNTAWAHDGQQVPARAHHPCPSSMPFVPACLRLLLGSYHPIPRHAGWQRSAQRLRLCSTGTFPQAVTPHSNPDPDDDPESTVHADTAGTEPCDEYEAEDQVAAAEELIWQQFSTLLATPDSGACPAPEGSFQHRYWHHFHHSPPAKVLEKLSVPDYSVSGQQPNAPSQQTPHQQIDPRETLYSAHLDQLVQLLGRDLAHHVTNREPGVLQLNPRLVEERYRELQKQFNAAATSPSDAPEKDKDPAAQAVHNSVELLLRKHYSVDEAFTAVSKVLGVPKVLVWVLTGSSRSKLKIRDDADVQGLVGTLDEWLVSEGLPGQFTYEPGKNRPIGKGRSERENRNPLLFSELLKKWRYAKLDWANTATLRASLPAWLQAEVTDEELQLASWPRLLLVQALWPGVTLDSLWPPGKKMFLNKLSESERLDKKARWEQGLQVCRASHHLLQWLPQTAPRGPQEDAPHSDDPAARRFRFTRACLLANPRLLQLKPQTVKARLGALSEAAASHPEWRYQLQCADPSSLSRMLVATGDEYCRLRLIVSERMQEVLHFPLYSILTHKYKDSDRVSEVWQVAYNKLAHIKSDKRTKAPAKPSAAAAVGAQPAQVPPQAGDAEPGPQSPHAPSPTPKPKRLYSCPKCLYWGFVDVPKTHYEHKVQCPYASHPPVSLCFDPTKWRRKHRNLVISWEQRHAGSEERRAAVERVHQGLQEEAQRVRALVSAISDAN